jgi:hypothetical protein
MKRPVLAPANNEDQICDIAARVGETRRQDFSGRFWRRLASYQGPPFRQRVRSGLQRRRSGCKFAPSLQMAV